MRRNDNTTSSLYKKTDKTWQNVHKTYKISF